MAIFKSVIISIKDNKATLSEEIYLYIGDGGITFLIEVVEPFFKFGRLRPDNLNVIEESDIQWASICILKPDGTVVECPRCEILDGKIRFELTKDFMDDINEEGVHQLQIHLYDGEGLSSNRLTIPPISFNVINPICNLK